MALFQCACYSLLTLAVCIIALNRGRKERSLFKEDQNSTQKYCGKHRALALFLIFIECDILLSLDFNYLSMTFSFAKQENQTFFVIKTIV